MAETKECRMCHKVKAADQFTKCSHNSDGLKSYCRECISKINRAYRTSKTEQRAKELSNEYARGYRDGQAAVLEEIRRRMGHGNA